MISWLEVTRDCIRRLGKKRMSLNEYDALLSVYESELLPELEGLIGPIDQLMEKAEDKDDLELDIASLKSQVLHALRKISGSKHRDDLIEPKLICQQLLKRISKPKINSNGLDDARITLEGEVLPWIDSVIEKEQKMNDSDDDNFDDILFSKRDYKAQLLQMRLETEREKLEDLKLRRMQREQGIYGGNQPGQNALVPQTIVVKGEDGQDEIKTVYVSSDNAQNENSLTGVLLSTIVKLLGNDNKGDTEATIQLRRDLEETRRMAREAEERARQEREARHQESMRTMSEKIDNAYRAAAQDPYDSYFRMKEKLQDRGLETDPHKSAEQAAAEKTSKILETGLEKIDRRAGALEDTAKKVVDMQVQHIQQQHQQQGSVPAIPHHTEGQKVRIYEELLKIDELDEDE